MRGLWKRVSAFRSLPVAEEKELEKIHDPDPVQAAKALMKFSHITKLMESHYKGGVHATLYCYCAMRTVLLVTEETDENRKFMESLKKISGELEAKFRKHAEAILAFVQQRTPVAVSPLN